VIHDRIKTVDSRELAIARNKLVADTIRFAKRERLEAEIKKLSMNP